MSVWTKALLEASQSAFAKTDSESDEEKKLKKKLSLVEVETDPETEDKTEDGTKAEDTTETKSENQSTTETVTDGNVKAEDVVKTEEKSEDGSEEENTESKGETEKENVPDTKGNTTEENTQSNTEESKSEDLSQTGDSTEVGTQPSGEVVTETAIGEIVRPIYEKLTYTPLTDEEIAEMVKQGLSEYRSQSLQAIEDQAKLTVEAQNSAKQSAYASRVEQEKATQSLYEEAKRNVDADLIKRGIARSSMAGLLTVQNESERAGTLSKILQEYEQTIADLDGQIAQAETNRQKAIDDFNIGYAVKYSQQVQELKKEREEKIAEVAKYNNQLAQQEYEDELNAQKAGSALKSQQLSQQKAENELQNDYGVTSPTVDADKKIYDIFRAQLSAMSAQDAKNALKNDRIYADNLSTAYYLRLVEEFGR